MKSKKRFLYLDIARVFSVLLVIFYHTNIHIKNFNIQTNYSTAILNNHYTGVIPFILISGIALTINIKDKTNWKEFFLKRVKSVLPLLWIAYLIQYFILYCQNGRPPLSLNWRIIFTIIGLDGYLNHLIPTLHLGIGEWFIGLILILYIIYPIFLKILLSSKKLFMYLGILLYTSSFIIQNYTGYPSFLLMASVFCLGMFLGYVNIPVNPKITLLALAIFSFFIVFYVPFGGTVANIGSLSDILVSVSGIVILKNICEPFNNNYLVNQIFKYFSILVYGMTLVNQQVIVKVLAKYSNQAIGNFTVLKIYTCIIFFIIILSVLLNFILKIFSKCFR